MSCGLFDRLPEDVINVLWNSLEPSALAKAATINTKFSARSNNPRLWHNHVSQLLNFNTFLRPELVEEYEKANSESVDSEEDLGIKIVKSSLVHRYKCLQRSDRLVNFDDFIKNQSFGGYLRPENQPERSWRQLWAAASLLLNPKLSEMSSWLRTYSLESLCDILVKADAQKRSLALKLLSAIPLQSFEVWRLRDLDSPLSDTSSSPLLFEKLCFLSSAYTLRCMRPALAYLGDSTALLLVLAEEFSYEDEEDRVGTTSDGTMLLATHRYIMHVAGGPEKAFSLLVEQLGLHDVLQNKREPIQDKIIRVANAGKAVKVPQNVRAGCILLLHLAGFGDQIVSHLMDARGDKYVASAVFRVVKATSTLAATKRHLHDVLGNAKNSTRARLRAAWMLKLLGVNVQSMELHKRGIQGYPHPWNFTTPLPDEVRKRILHFYRKDMLLKTSLALLLEAHSFTPEPYEDYEKVDATTISFEGVEILGPYTATELHDDGAGTYNGYKVYISSEGSGLMIGPEDRSMSMAVLLTCTFGPYACIRRNDIVMGHRRTGGTLFIGKECEMYDTIKDKDLPNWEQAEKSLRVFAAKYGWAVLDNDLLDCRFNGMVIDTSGVRIIPHIRDLLFNFQH